MMATSANHGAAHLARCERYRRKRERLGARVALLSWPDGTWCVLAMHPTRAGLVVLGDDSKTDAYDEARRMMQNDLLPLLALRQEFNA